MRVLLLSGSSSVHTVRWANGLVECGVEVHVVSLHRAIAPFHPDVSEHHLGPNPPLGYFLAVPTVRRLMQRIRPDIVNAHYASGYGTLARLCRARPLMLSVWGSDVYDFPKGGPVNRWMIRRNVEYADSVASTSLSMEAETRRWATPKVVFITPFGVDPELFQPKPDGMPATGRELITIGTVKTLAPKYGVDTLLEGFAHLRSELVAGQQADLAERLRLLIIGGGGQHDELVRLATRLGIGHVTEFRGRVPHEQVPRCLHELDVYVALSRLDSESFGVAILEASASGIPVVVSDADGPKEMTVDGVTGYIVPRDEPKLAAEALGKLVRSEELRRQMGRAGREHVLSRYTWRQSLSTMLDAYRQTMEVAKRRRTS